MSLLTILTDIFIGFLIILSLAQTILSFFYLYLIFIESARKIMRRSIAAKIMMISLMVELLMKLLVIEGCQITGQKAPFGFSSIIWCIALLVIWFGNYKLNKLIEQRDEPPLKE